MESGPDTAHILWHARPVLRDPVLVAAFEGWNDAGDAATTAVAHLRDRSESLDVATIDPEEFYDFTVARPVVELDDGVRSLRWPENRFWAVHTDGPNDLVVLVGMEPQTRWRTFCRQILGVVDELGVSRVVTLGALLADVPHQRPVPVYGATDDPAAQAELGLQTSSYEGPTGIVGVLGALLGEAEIPSASFWAAVPAYVPGATSPKAALALVERLQGLLGLRGATTDLEIATSAYERQVDEIVAEDDETAEYVAQLEDDHDRSAELRPVSGDELVQEVERFLRDQPE